jgi:hypothetical protein
VTRLFANLITQQSSQRVISLTTKGLALKAIYLTGFNLTITIPIKKKLYDIEKGFVCAG